MSNRRVHWFEGMFLRPHHFQLFQRSQSELSHRGDKWDVHYNWGMRSIDLDLDALANYRLVVRSVEARLRDGTTISVPDDGILPQLELKSAFEKSKSVTVFLGVPALNLGRANVSDNGVADLARYKLDTQPLEDENTGVNPQPITVRMLNIKLLLSTQDHTGYEVLPIARIERAAKVEATPQLDETYIPPLLTYDAWKTLVAGILHPIYDRIGKKIELLSTQVVSRNIGFDSSAQGDRLILQQLRELNEAYAYFGVQFFAQGEHPLNVYIELCRLVGKLAVFGSTRRTPELPKYDHDDLGVCFYRVKKYVDALLSIFVEPEYKERPFIGAGLRMQVTLEPIWLESIWSMYIGVQSQLETEDLIRLVTKPGQLDMKIGSSDRVDTIFRYGSAGLRFVHSPRPPRALPQLPGLIYFQIMKESQEAEWQNVQKSLTLAIRLNENLIAGNIQGQQILTIKTAGENTTLQFTLYVVPQDVK